MLLSSTRSVVITFYNNSPNVIFNFKINISENVENVEHNFSIISLTVYKWMWLQALSVSSISRIFSTRWLCQDNSFWQVFGGCLGRNQVYFPYNESKLWVIWRRLIVEFWNVLFSDECTVPAIEVLVKCIHGLNVGKQCVKKLYQVSF